MFLPWKWKCVVLTHPPHTKQYKTPMYYPLYYHLYYTYYVVWCTLYKHRYEPEYAVIWTFYLNFFILIVTPFVKIATNYQLRLRLLLTEWNDDLIGIKKKTLLTPVNWRQYVAQFTGSCVYILCLFSIYTCIFIQSIHTFTHSKFCGLHFALITRLSKF